MMDSENSSLKRHPIQVVARRTGLTVDVLRVWEKRYGVVEPTRSPGGHRLYSDDDVERLNLLRSATEAGRRISKVADLTLSDLRSLVREDADAAVNRHRVSRDSLSPAPEEHLSACLEAVDGVDGRRLETTLTRASVALAAPVLIEQVLAPLMAAIGERWEHGRLSPGQEHLASSVIRRVLESLTPQLKGVRSFIFRCEETTRKDDDYFFNLVFIPQAETLQRFNSLYHYECDLSPVCDIFLRDSLAKLRTPDRSGKIRLPEDKAALLDHFLLGG